MTLNDPTAKPSHYEPVELVWIGDCPECGQPCSYFQKPSEAFPRTRCDLCHPRKATR